MPVFKVAAGCRRYECFVAQWRQLAAATSVSLRSGGRLPPLRVLRCAVAAGCRRYECFVAQWRQVAAATVPGYSCFLSLAMISEKYPASSGISSRLRYSFSFSMLQFSTIWTSRPLLRSIALTAAIWLADFIST